MTTVAYAMSDFAAVRVPVDRGGCGEQHQADIGDGGHPRVECAQCAPVLIAGHYGFASSPVDVPLTPDERAYREAAVGDAAVNQSSLLNSLAARMAPQRSLTEQVAGMSDEERAGLRKLLGPAPRKTASR